MREQLFIHATNVHQGGGRTLLDALLRLTHEPGTTVLLDERMPLPRELPSSTSVVRVRPTVLGRLKAEFLLAEKVGADDTVLCFGNLPPLFRVAGRVIVFVQNRYLIEDVSLDQLAGRARMRLAIERAWFRLRAAGASEFVVQTPSMKGAIETRLQAIGLTGKYRVRILPFMPDTPRYLRARRNGGKAHCKYDFVYVGSGDAHKNHRSLVDAWALLAAENHQPTLALTINEKAHPELCKWVEEQSRRHNLRIENLGELPASAIAELYLQSGALIYPSKFESLGLPLIEARNAGLSVLASELDYVRDVLDPEETFDPGSPVSIARAVKRFMAIEEPALQVVDAEQFIRELLAPGRDPE